MAELMRLPVNNSKILNNINLIFDPTYWLMEELRDSFLMF
uniref:Uncharacterized protein n=1 Tax=Ascaris lumbricoides TaxID=6252 RepID=A0A0M3HI14_ASCLU